MYPPDVVHVLHMCECVTHCKVDWQTRHILQKPNPLCVALHRGCSLNVAESKQSGNGRHAPRVVCVSDFILFFFVFPESVGEAVTGFL